jgi:hypothetical protein
MAASRLASWRSIVSARSAEISAFETPVGATAASPTRTSRMVVLALDERLGGVDRDGGVAAIGVGADGLAEILVERRAADQHDIVVAHAFLDQRVDHDLHVGHGGRQQRGHAENVGLLALDGFEIVLDRVVDADIDHLEPGAFHHHRDEVLADVVDVALDRADDHLALLGRAGLGQQRLQHRHPGLHRVGGQKHFGDEQDAVAEIVAHDLHAGDQRLGQHVIGLPAALEQDVRALDDFLLEAVIEVVMHLRDEFLVVELAQDDVVVFFGHSCRLHAAGSEVRPKG